MDRSDVWAEVLQMASEKQKFTLSEARDEIGGGKDERTVEMVIQYMVERGWLEKEGRDTYIRGELLEGLKERVRQ